MLKIQNLTKKFGNKTALQNINLELLTGEVFCLIGPNGSGKTTLIKTIAGLLQPSAGKILVGNADVAQNPQAAKAQIGYIPDEPTVWNSVTGEEFLHLVGALYDMPEAKRSEEIKRLLPLFSLQGIETEYFEDYSRGNKQKFSILAALLHHPKLLLVDEPIVGLDPGSADVAKQQFKLFAQNHGTVLMVTHTLPVAEAIADRIGFLHNGQLQALGTLAELRTKANLPTTADLESVYNSLNQVKA